MRDSERLQGRRVAAFVTTVLGAAAAIAWVLAERAPLATAASFAAMLMLTAIGAELLTVDLPGCEGGISFALPFAATLAVVWSPAVSFGLLLAGSCVGVLLARKKRTFSLVANHLALVAIATGVATLALILYRRFVSESGAAPYGAIAFMIGYAGTAYGGRRFIEAGLTGLIPPPDELLLEGLGGAKIGLFAITAVVVVVASVDHLTWLLPLTLLPIWALGCGLRKRARMSESYYETVTALTMMLQRAHPYTHEHVDRVARAAELVARRLGLPGDRARLVRAAAVLHDIGKIAVDESILDKPGALSESERRHVENHPVWGAQILAPVRQFHDLLPWIRHHHERPDGTGYPDGLSDVEIPIESKIIAVVDAYDAMTDSGRSYRSPMSPYEAIEELRRCSGTQFDYAVVEVFGEMVTQGAG